MLFGVNQATLEKCRLPEFLAAAGKAGYEMVELREEKIAEYLVDRSIGDIRDLFRLNKVRPHTINALGMSTMLDAEGERKILKAAGDFAAKAAALDCPWIVACPGAKAKTTSWDEIVVRSAKTVGKMADIAWKRRVRLAFEFLGFGWSSAQTVSEAWAIVKAANRGNAGIAVDSAHFYSGSSNLAEISALPREAVAVFHVNDLVDKAKDKIGDYDRVMPGEGVVPLRDIARELRRIGFAGVASLEIFNRGYHKRDPLEIARAGLGGMEAFLK
ncbi:MAG: sugar phosphate isomerase/epimerase [Planctomycetota bacterium]|jgi:2-keto-myo-inositol isomerase|nr:sugar phosphate isomerase/epimerase [Planctomycetota bacterium]